MIVETVDIFQAHGKTYKIKLSCNGTELSVRAFLNDQPANGNSYHVTIEVADDMRFLAGQDAIKELIKIAKDDVIEKRYEKLVEILNTHRKTKPAPGSTETQSLS